MTEALLMQEKKAESPCKARARLPGIKSRLAWAGGLHEFAAQRKPLAAQPPLVQRQAQPEEEEQIQTKGCPGLIQRDAAPEEEEELQTKPLAAQITPLVQRQAQPEEEELQTKLVVGPPDDEYEREADRVADQVVSMPEPKVQRACRKCEEEEAVQTKPLAAQITPLVQRQAQPEEEEQIQTKRLDGSARQQKEAMGASSLLQRKCRRATSQEDAVSSGVDRVLAGSGSPLERKLQSEMGQRFGKDFSRVRVHYGAAAEQSARSLNAHAYTLGHNIVFGAGRYVPESQEGRRLIAHELTHVVQQSGVKRTGAGEIKGRPTLSQASPQVIRADKPDAGTSDAGPSDAESSIPGGIPPTAQQNESVGHAFLRIENPSDSSKNITRGFWPACA